MGFVNCRDIMVCNISKKIASKHSKSAAMFIIIALIVLNENGTFAAQTFILLQPSGKTADFV